MWERRLTCGNSPPHHLKNIVNIDETGSIRCSHWIAEEHRECGLWIWVVSFRGGGYLVADVSLEDLKHLKTLSTPSERIAYLGIFEEGAA